MCVENKHNKIIIVKIKIKTINILKINFREYKMSEVQAQSKVNQNKRVKQVKELEWKQDLIDNAIKKHHYLKINNGKLSNMNLNSISNRWKKGDNQDEIYVSRHHVGGVEASVVKYLLLQFDQNHVNEVVASAYTYSNYLNTKQDEFQRELQAYREYRKASVPKPKQTLEINPENLSRIVKELSGVSGTNNVQKNRKKHCVIEKYNSLPEGKFLDVTGLTSDGSGMTVRSKVTSGKYGNFNNVRIISSASERANFEFAVKAVKPEVSVDCCNQFKASTGSSSKGKKQKPRSRKAEVVTTEVISTPVENNQTQSNVNTTSTLSSNVTPQTTLATPVSTLSVTALSTPSNVLSSTTSSVTTSTRAGAKTPPRSGMTTLENKVEVPKLSGPTSRRKITYKSPSRN